MKVLAVICLLILTSCAIIGHTERTYYPTGELCGEMFFERGEITSYKEYYESGKLKLSIDYGDLRYVETKFYGENGLLQRQTREER